MSTGLPVLRFRVMPVLVLLALLAACQQASFQPSLPDLPEKTALGLENEPEQIRAVIEAAYDEAAGAPASEYAAGKLAMLLHAHEQFAAAALVYQRAEALAPETFQWPYLRGVILQQEGEPETAVAAFRTALKLLPGNAPARLRLADSLLVTGELEQSEQLYTEFLEQYERAPRGLYGMGRIHLEREEWEQAASYLQRAVDRNARYGKAHQALAEALRRMGRTDDAKLHLDARDQERDIEPSPPDRYLADVGKLSLKPSTLRSRALAQIRIRRYAEARKTLNRILEIDPNHVVARTLLMSVARLTGGDEEFLRLFNEAIAVKQDFTPFHKEHGLYLTGKGRLEEAADAYKKALEYDPQSAAIHWLFGRLRERQGREAEAEQLYRRSLELDPESVYVESLLGRVLIVRGKHREGIELLEACRIRGNDDRARNALSLASAYSKTGEAARSQKSLDTAAALARVSRDKELIAEVERRLGRSVF